MICLKARALSVNKCWRGRRFKTDTYLDYEIELFSELKKTKKIEIPKGKMQVEIEVGLSSKLADLDNIAKPLIDILQKYYGFNDKQIYKLVMVKVDVKKKEEYIKFNLKQL